MPVTVRVPQPLRKLTQNKDTVSASGSTVLDVINSLEASYPGLRERLCDETGELRRFVNVYLNGEDIRFVNGLSTGLKEGDEVSIVPAMAGG
jgi:molybdopterin synthase sulfur carrier subunit